MAASGVAMAVAFAPLSGARLTAAKAPGTVIRGLDISAYQHVGVPVDWRLIARRGIRFAAIKLAEGTYYTNPYYSADAKGAKAAGLAVLPYVFANPGVAYGSWTAKFAVKVMRASGQPAGLPLVADLENDPYRENDDCYGLDVPQMVSWVSGFVTEAHALTRQWPVIYTTAAWWRECTGLTGRFRRDPLWLAAYDGAPVTVPFPWRHWTFWQYSDDGLLPGLDQPDLDYYQPTGDLPALGTPARKPRKPRKPAHHKHKTKSKKKPKPKPKHHQPRSKHPKPKPKHRKP
jgi:GH25 family lysozyme M1 (1,4-beta-N-acetylmuramidase)